MKTSHRARILFLDDSQDRREIFRKHNPSSDVVETASEAIAALQKKDYEIVSLDHDLCSGLHKDGRSDETGMAVVRWILRHRPTIRQIVVHSSNAAAADRMVQALSRAGYHSFRRPFGFRGWKTE